MQIIYLYKIIEIKIVYIIYKKWNNIVMLIKSTLIIRRDNDFDWIIFYNLIF